MLQTAQGFLTTILSFVFVLGLVVTIHELGHFLVARWCGVAVDRFSIGFGKAIVSWRDRAGVEWRIGWIPLGGYVRFSGDDNAASLPDAENLAALRRRIELEEGAGAAERYFHFKPLWQRALVVAAGPFANFLLAIVLFAVLAGAFGRTVMPPEVVGVQAGSPAARAGFQVGDVIKSAGGRPVEEFTDFVTIVRLRPGKATEFVLERDGREVVVTATPDTRIDKNKRMGEFKVGQIGVNWPKPEHRRYAPLDALALGVDETAHILSTTAFVLSQMVTGQVSPTNISGFLGIAAASGAVAEQGAVGAPNPGQAILRSLVALLGLIAVMSISIGFMNLLPVPVLDGGHLLFYAYEAVARRPVAAVVQAVGYRVGLVMLLGLMVFATINDLQRWNVFKILGGLFS